MRLKDKICVVTGSSRGIGAAIARAFARDGARVAITYFEQRVSAERVAGECHSDMLFQLDVRDRLQLRSVFQAVHARHGRIDVLVNNAGVNRPNDFDQSTEEEWDHVLDVNLKGTFLSCQEVLRFLSANGRVINIGSLSGEYGGPRTVSYAAAKAGVMALTHCLARFVSSRGITVNCLSPGVIASEMTSRTMSPQVRELVDNLLLIKRLGAPEEIAAAAVFLASDDAAYITGQTISVNGGAWVR